MQIWSRNNLNLRSNETLELHRVDGNASVIGRAGDSEYVYVLCIRIYILYTYMYYVYVYRGMYYVYVYFVYVYVWAVAVLPLSGFAVFDLASVDGENEEVQAKASPPLSKKTNK